MSLLRLLTAGKSLVGAKSATFRYRFSDPRSMPKFRSTVNPFKTKTEKGNGAEAPRETGAEKAKADGPGGTDRTDGNPQIAAIRAVAEAVIASGAGPAEATADEACQMVSEPVAPVALNKPEQPAAVIQRQAGKWISKLSSLTGKWRLRRKVTDGRAERRPVQAELSLENIKVVRNDLSESDLEIVPAASKVGAKTASTPRPSPPKEERATSAVSGRGRGDGADGKDELVAEAEGADRIVCATGAE